MTSFNETIEVERPWSDWIFLRQNRDTEGGGGFHIHNPWGNSNQWQGHPDRNALVIAYKTPSGQDLWNKGISFHGPTGKLRVSGDIVAGGDISLEGADCAEEFAVNNLEEIEPGTVMVIGHEDALCQSSKAYDKKVAGVVSGAGNFKPALILDKKAKSTNRKVIALMGKVYCKVDARFAPIEVGDLLTTSCTRGYAMKAADPAKAFGTVIGKALRSMEAGTGLIPILVSLQ